MLAGLLLVFSNTLLYTRKFVPFGIRRYYYIVLYLYCTIYNVPLTDRYIASWERCVALWERNVVLWESNVTNVVSRQHHIILLMICKTVKWVEEKENYVYKIAKSD